MSESQKADGIPLIRVFEHGDEDAVVALWDRCGLTTPANDPRADIRLKIDFQPELFFVGDVNGEIVATVMAGWDGHRGWLYSLAVTPERQRGGIGRNLVAHAEAALRAFGCLKVNLQVRGTNTHVIAFYESLGFAVEDRISLGKRL